MTSATGSTGIRHSPLHDRHQALGASFTDFGGWLMPVRYTSELDEHHAVRTGAGLFDISHMAEFTVTGPESGAFLDAALAGRLSTLPTNKAKYSLLLAYHGGIIDDVIVYRLRDDQFLIIANAGNRAAVAQALNDRSLASHMAAEVADVSDSYALIAVQGPLAAGILSRTSGLDLAPLSDLGYYASIAGHFAGNPILVARTGYTGEDGFELLITANQAAQLWDALLRAGDTVGLVPAGLAARDTLRLEAGMPLYGHELSLNVLPAQAGLGRTVAIDKSDFVGRSGIIAARDEPPVLVGLVSEGRRAGRAGYAVLHADEVIGEITSGALSPTLGVPIAMAYVAPHIARPGTVVTIDVRGTSVPATVTALPFYRRTK